MNRKYCPSNGTEGVSFVESHCANCIHEKFIHTQNHSDKKCDIFSRTLLHAVNEPEFPEEWTYDGNGDPTCTAFVRWNWGNNDDEGGLNDPPPDYPVSPNQLVMPFIFDELEIKKHEQAKEPANIDSSIQIP